MAGLIQGQCFDTVSAQPLKPGGLALVTGAALDVRNVVSAGTGDFEDV